MSLQIADVPPLPIENCSILEAAELRNMTRIKLLDAKEVAEEHIDKGLFGFTYVSNGTRIKKYNAVESDERMEKEGNDEPRDDPASMEPYKACLAMKEGIGPDIYGAFQENNHNVTISMEDMSLGTLRALLDELHDKGVQPKKASVHELDEAVLKLVHRFERTKIPMCHLDLHGDNIALKRDPSGDVVAKAIDWGLSKFGDNKYDCKEKSFCNSLDIISELKETHKYLRENIEYSCYDDDRFAYINGSSVQARGSAEKSTRRAMRL